MENKTCGECRKFKSIRCGHSEASHPVCCAFKPKMTNGDRIRQKSNKELAVDCAMYSKTHNLYVARLCPLGKQLWTTMEEAIQANLDYLNSPAESEVEDE